MLKRQHLAKPCEVRPKGQTPGTYLKRVLLNVVKLILQKDISYSDTWLQSTEQELDRCDIETVLGRILELLQNDP